MTKLNIGIVVENGKAKMFVHGNGNETDYAHALGQLKIAETICLKKYIELNNFETKNG